MIKNILVPTDFSELSLKALDFALDLSNITKADLYILNTFVTPYEFASRLDMVLDSYRKDSEKKLQQLVKDLKTRDDVNPEKIKIFVEVGEMVSTTTRFVEKHKIDLIILGTQGASGIKKALIGSNTAELLKETPCHILAIPEKATYDKINSFIYATDHTENDVSILKKLNRFRAFFGEIKINTLHVAKEKNFETEIRFFGYKAYLKKVTELSKVRHHLIINKDPEKGIAAFTQNRKNSILVVVPHKKSIWNMIFGKSLSVSLSYHTHLPILAFKN